MRDVVFSTEFAAPRFKMVSMATALILAGIALVVPPLFASKFPARELFNAAKNDLRPEMKFGAVDFTEPSLVWYFRSRVDGWMTTLDGETVKPFMEKPGPRFVIVPTNLAETLFATRPADWKTFTHEGFNVAKGKRVELTLLLKPE